MKRFFEVVLLSLGLYGIDYIITGVSMGDQIYYYIIGGVLLTILFELIKPVLSLVLLPLNFLTLGFAGTLVMFIVIFLVAQFSGVVSYDNALMLAFFSITTGIYSSVVTTIL